MKEEEVSATEQGQGSAKTSDAAAPHTSALPTLRVSAGIAIASSGASTREEDIAADNCSVKRTPHDHLEEKSKECTTGFANMASGSVYPRLPSIDTGAGTGSWCCPWCGFKNFSACPVCEVCGETIYPEENLIENDGTEAAANKVDAKLPAENRRGEGVHDEPNTAFQKKIDVQVHLSVVTDVEELTAHDILLAPEHGREFQYYAGNMKLATLIRGACYEYHSASYKKRAEMIPAVVQQVKKHDPPSRFLKLESGTVQWVEVPDDYANLHVLQLFLRCMTQQEKDRFVQEPAEGDSCQGIRVWDIQDACVPKEAYEASSVRKANSLKVEPASSNEDGGASVQSDCATMDRLEADEIAQDLCEAWSRHDTIRQVMTCPTDHNAAADDRIDDRCRALASLRAAAVSLETDDIAADDLLRTETLQGDSSRLQTLQQELCDMSLDDLEAAAGSPENHEHLRALKIRRKENALFPQPPASDCQLVSKDNVADNPFNEAGWQNRYSRPNHGCDIVNKIIWQLRWGTESEASRYYVVNRCLIPDTGKEEILKHAIQYVDKAVILTLFPGLPLPATSNDERTTVQMNRRTGKRSMLCEANQQHQMCFVGDTTRNDVLCGAGNAILPREGEGNARFRELVEAKKEEFAKCVAYQDRLAISKQLVDQWRCQDPPGRFLEQQDRYSIWYDIGDAKAKMKTTQILRRLLWTPSQKTVGYDRAPDATGTENPQFDTATSETNSAAIKLQGRCSEDYEADEAVAVVAAVAMYNYECFHDLKRGTASFETVAATSAGIEGWAASVIPEDSSSPKRDNISVDDSERKCAARPQEPKKRRDPEEDRQLQIALLESVGAFPNRLEPSGYACSSDSSCSEGEWSDYQYEDDEEGEEESQGCEYCQETSEEESEEEAQNEDSDTRTVPTNTATMCCDPQEPVKDERKLVTHKTSESLDIIQANVPTPVYAPDNSVNRNMNAHRAVHLAGLSSHETEEAQKPTSDSDGESWSNISSALSGSSGTLVERGDGQEISCESTQSGEKYLDVGKMVQEEVVLDGELSVADDWSDVSNAESVETQTKTKR